MTQHFLSEIGKHVSAVVKEELPKIAAKKEYWRRVRTPLMRPNGLAESRCNILPSYGIEGTCALFVEELRQAYRDGRDLKTIPAPVER